MTQDDIIRMAKESGLASETYTAESSQWSLPKLKRFAEAVAAAEREECAKLCDARALANQQEAKISSISGSIAHEGTADDFLKCASDIRARGEHQAGAGRTG